MSVDGLKRKFVENKIVIMDGAMGTEILRRGIKTTLPLWSASALFSHPEVIKQIHKDYIQAGAEIIITNTFRTTRRSFAKIGETEKAKESALIACKLAREAREEAKATYPVYIAGSIAPLEDCYMPELVPSDIEMQTEHLELAQNLKDGGVDFLLIETMNTIKESVIALEAAAKTGLAVAVSFCCDEKLTLLSGESIEDAIKQVAKFKPIFIGVNCAQAKVITQLLSRMRKTTQLPLAAYANGPGKADDGQGWEFVQNVQIQDYVAEAKKWVSLGATIIGGCCGTDPSYITQLSVSLKAK